MNLLYEHLRKVRLVILSIFFSINLKLHTVLSKKLNTQYSLYFWSYIMTCIKSIAKPILNLLSRKPTHRKPFFFKANYS